MEPNPKSAPAAAATKAAATKASSKPSDPDPENVVVRLRRRLKRSPLYSMIELYVRTVHFLTRVWESIIFRVLLLVGLNVLAYFGIEALGENSYNRYTKAILIANMALLFVFLPGLHVTREAMRKHNISPVKHYVTTIFLVMFLFIMLALSANFFLPYFLLSSKTNVGATQRFVVIFLIVFFYAMLFMTHGERMARLYNKIKGIPFLPSSTFVQSLLNIARFGVLYVLVCLPVDLCTTLKNLVLGNYKVDRAIVGIVVLLLFFFVLLYHRQIADGTLRLNSDLVVLRKCTGEVYLHRQTNLGRYNDLIPWYTLDAVGKRKRAVVSRSAIDPIEDDDGTPSNLYIGKTRRGTFVFGTIITTISDKTDQILSGELSVEDAWEQLKKHIKEDVYAPVRDWLVQPFEEDPQTLAGQRKETQHLIVEGFREGAQGAQCSKHTYSDVKADLDAEEAAAIEDAAYEDALHQFHSDDDGEKVATRPHDVDLVSRTTDEFHPIAYSISLWVYIAPLTDNYPSEKTLLNFSNKLILCLGRDGTTMYVDIDAEWNKHDGKLNENPLAPKARQSGRVGKRVFALDTFAHQRWNHVVITTDHDGRMNAFINRVLVATNVHVRPSTSARNDMIYLGEKNGARGKATCVYYYSKTLTQFDVSLLYNKVPHLV